MENTRILIRKPLAEISHAEEFFRRLSGIDINHIPEKYGDAVTHAREILISRAEAVLLARRVPILQQDEETVLLAEDARLSGKMPPKVLAGADEVICFVGTLAGFSSESEDMMEEYFIDTWGSAYIEAAQAWFAAEVQTALAQEGKKRTHLWCPGQHQFELINQKALFQLLAPEDVGCTLTKRFMMLPTKSVSGIMGVVGADDETLLRPCDFCHFKATCPSTQQGCAVL